AHGEPLGDDELRAAKRALGWPEDKTFYVPDEVYDHLQRVALDEGAARQAAWEDLVERYAAAHPELAAEFKAWLRRKLPEGWEDALPTFPAGEKVATRNASGKVLG